VTTDGLVRVLIIEDSEADAMLLARALRLAGHGVDARRVESEAEMRAALAEGSWDVVLSDWTMPGFTAAAALELVRESGRDIPFVIVSGTIDEEIAGEAMRAGARDYVLKDRLGRLAPAVERELRDAAERRRARIAMEQSEERLRKAQKMEAIGDFAGSIAHDFNNLLSVIASYADIALEELEAGASLRDDMHEIRKAARRAQELTAQLLAFSRRQALELRSIDLSELVRERAALATTRCRPRPRPCGPGTARAGGGEPGAERSRRDAAWRHVDDRDDRRGWTRRDDGERHRQRHGPRDDRTHLRAVLHEQGRGAGRRHGPRDGARRRAAVRRNDLGG
jgi:CheY-like chemotaxis protein